MSELAPRSQVWLAAIGFETKTPALWHAALTHGSTGEKQNYERLEFLGDRVLGLLMAEWLWDVFPREAEGQLSKRLNALVTGAVCAEVAREIVRTPILRCDLWEGWVRILVAMQAMNPHERRAGSHIEYASPGL